MVSRNKQALIAFVFCILFVVTTQAKSALGASLGKSTDLAGVASAKNLQKTVIRDVVLMLNCVFLASGACNSCFADVNCDGALMPADVV